MSRFRTIHRLGFASLILLATIIAYTAALAQTGGAAQIVTPAADDALRGAIQISGTAASPAFASANLAFAYPKDASNTWFPIAIIDQPVLNGDLGTWDTTAISDGEYVLRLQVSSIDGTQMEFKVSVQVRNYTSPVATPPSPTPTVFPRLGLPTPVVMVASATALPVTPAPPTPLPSNPVAVSDKAVYVGFARGALLVTVLVLVVAAAILRRQI